MGRRGLAVVAQLSMVLGLALGTEAARAQTPAPAPDRTDAQAQADEEEEPPTPAGGHDIVPEPNSGRDPQDAGDPGGALQIVVFLAIVGGITALGLLVRRDIRQRRPPEVSNRR